MSMKIELNRSQSRRLFFRTSVLLGAATAIGVLPRAMTAAEPPKLPTRQPIELLDPIKLEKLEGAIKEMMERSEKNVSDPKGWLANAESHRNFCSSPGFNGLNQIHFCYWFLPWHRAYIAITERKIREIAGDSSLAFPYWNWSTQRRIPQRFLRPGSALSNASRFTPDRPLNNGEVDYIPDDPVQRTLGVGALAATKFSATPRTSPVEFVAELSRSFGGVPRPNSLAKYGNSRIEGTPHGPVHVYVGGENSADGRLGDMTDFATAARDPLFFAHHGNLDRLWEKWRNIGSNRGTEPDSKDFVEHRFPFPWLDGSTVEVSVADTLDTKILGYQYDSLDVISIGPTQAQPESSNDSIRLPAIVDAPLNLPAIPEASGLKPRYFLVIEDIDFPDRVMSAGVYITHRNSKSDGMKVLVGSIAVVRSGSRYEAPREAVIFDISSAVRTLGTSSINAVVIPNPIGSEIRRPYAPLRYKSISVILSK